MQIAARKSCASPALLFPLPKAARALRATRRKSTAEPITALRSFLIPGRAPMSCFSALGHSRRLITFYSVSILLFIFFFPCGSGETCERREVGRMSLLLELQLRTVTWTGRGTSILCAGWIQELAWELRLGSNSLLRRRSNKFLILSGKIMSSNLY